LLATAGGAVGIGVAYAVSRIVLAFAPVSIATPVPIDVRVLGFALTASLIMGLAFGLSPAVQGAKTARATLPGSRGSATGPRQSRARGALVVSQIVMSMVSIVAAGVLVQSLRHFLAQDPGFEVEGLVGTTIDLRTRDLDVETGIAFQREFLDRARALPGVEGASLTQIVPLSGAGRGGGLLAEGRTESFDMSYGVVAPGYFETLGIPVLRGRDFNLDDGPNAEGVVILSDLAAETLWPGEEAVGRRIRRDVDQPWLRVVGVVGTIAYYELGEQPQPYFYRPQFQRYGPVTTLLVRSALDRRTVVSSLRREIGSLDPELAVGRVRSMAELVASRSQSRRSSAVVATLFSGLALLLAAVGVFGTLSELVHQRRQEIGVRMALGARRGDVTRFIVAKGLGLGLLGVALGVPAAAGAVRLLSGFLFGVRSLDPLPFLGAAVVVIAVVLLATYLPARHAGRFDPARVLQSD
jgi:putative ABC transport system permease protein